MRSMPAAGSGPSMDNIPFCDLHKQSDERKWLVVGCTRMVKRKHFQPDAHFLNYAIHSMLSPPFPRK